MQQTHDTQTNDSVYETCTKLVVSEITLFNQEITENQGQVCAVCLDLPPSRRAFVPCGHSRFCDNCITELQLHDTRCPICHTPIQMIS